MHKVLRRSVRQRWNGRSVTITGRKGDCEGQFIVWAVGRKRVDWHRWNRYRASMNVRVRHKTHLWHGRMTSGHHANNPHTFCSLVRSNFGSFTSNLATQITGWSDLSAQISSFCFLSFMCVTNGWCVKICTKFNKQFFYSFNIQLITQNSSFERAEKTLQNHILLTFNNAISTDIINSFLSTPRKTLYKIWLHLSKA